MPRDAWDPEVDDASVPLVGEFKYPVDRPDGPVTCSSRRVSVAGEPGMTKQIMRAAPDDASPPAAHATCFVHYDMWQHNEAHAEVWSTRRESEPHQLILGDATRTRESHEAAVGASSEGTKEGEEGEMARAASSPPPLDSRRKHHVALDACLRTMRVGERALFVVPARLAYGDLGSFSFPAVPPSCALVADVELIGTKRASAEPARRADMLYEERISRVREHRARGNERYRAGDIASAANEYQMALSFLTDDMLMQLFGDYLAEAEAEKLPAHLNLAACFLAEQRYREAADQASRALSVDSTNAKAYYRRGRARQALGQDDGARADLLEALRRSPGGEDAAALAALRQLETEAVKTARAQKKTFGGLFAHEDEEGVVSSGEDDDSGLDASSSGSGSDDDDTRREKMEARRRRRTAKETARAARSRRAATTARDAEARMNDVDDAGDPARGSSSNRETPSGSTHTLGGVFSRILSTLGLKKREC